MRKLIEQAGKVLAAFQDQRSTLLQALQVNDAYAPILLKMLSDLDQENQSDISMLMPADFENTEQWVQAFVDQVEAEAGYLQELMDKEESAVALDLPSFEALHEPSTPAAERVRDAISLVKTLLPKEPGHRVIVALFPLNIADETSFLELVQQIIGEGAADPLWRCVRFIIRLPDPPVEEWQPVLTFPWVQVDAFDFSQPTIEQAYEEEANDVNLPDEQRTQALYSLAILDMGYSRNELALARLQQVLAHYQKTDNKTMQTAVMNTVGDLYRHRLDDVEQAEHWYSCATEPGAESSIPVILLPVVRNLGELAFEKNDLVLADQYFEQAEVLARHIPDPSSTAEVLDWRGSTCERQGDNESATDHWEGARQLAEAFELPDVDQRMQTNLQRIGAL